MSTRLLVLLRHASRAAVQLAGDGVRDIRELFLLLFEVFACGGGGVLVKPLGGFFDGFEELIAIMSAISFFIEDVVLSTHRFLVLLVDLASKSFVIVDLVL